MSALSEILSYLIISFETSFTFHLEVSHTEMGKRENAHNSSERPFKKERNLYQTKLTIKYSLSTKEQGLKKMKVVF